MKYIVKGHEPFAFTEWKAQTKTKPAFNRWYGAIKQQVKISLQTEQGFICCYCECRISKENSHIEHLVPQSIPESDSYNYANMLCSCQKNLSRGDPQHCGKLKDNWFDSNLFITPLQPDCERRFAYSIDGHIRPSVNDDNAASVTITKLGLDIPKLVDQRKKALEPYIDPVLSNEELRHFLNEELKQRSDGSFVPFYTTIEHFKNLLEAKQAHE